MGREGDLPGARRSQPTQAQRGRQAASHGPAAGAHNGPVVAAGANTVLAEITNGRYVFVDQPERKRKRQAGKDRSVIDDQSAAQPRRTHHSRCRGCRRSHSCVQTGGRRCRRPRRQRCTSRCQCWSSRGPRRRWFRGRDPRPPRHRSRRQCRCTAQRWPFQERTNRRHRCKT